MAKAGRPSKFTPEVTQEICERLASGESLRRICMDKHMPSERTATDWQLNNEDFRGKCARAREIAVDSMVDDTIEIADSATDADSAACARVRVSARQWYASKIASKKYGDRVAVDAKVNHTLADKLTAALTRASGADSDGTDG